MIWKKIIKKTGLLPKYRTRETLVSGYTDRGYRIINGTAYNEYDEPVYNVGRVGNYDEADDMNWGDKDY